VAAPAAGEYKLMRPVRVENGKFQITVNGCSSREEKSLPRPRLYWTLICINAPSRALFIVLLLGS